MCVFGNREDRPERQLQSPAIGKKMQREGPGIFSSELTSPVMLGRAPEDEVYAGRGALQRGCRHQLGVGLAVKGRALKTKLKESR